MAVGDIYLKFKNSSENRKEKCCLATDLHNCVHHYLIQQEIDEYHVPSGYYLLQRIYPKPEIPEGKVKGYHFKIEDGVMKRYYLVCEGPNDQQLLVLDDFEEAVQNFLDESVQKKGYDNVYTCLSYKDDPDPIFSAEAAAVLVWRSQVWRTAQSILNQWMTGQIQQPTVAEVLAQLPELVWPS